ncbi:hypothetical protein [Natronolimnohabitans innermongolicus]|uniref:Uncharacterized protein n=1 Tax=Natronolimnohabitans innermongolicus JCM 12255 TaxID=1227499 RepID=L9XEY7_9EURY|nr:hypothetical protein [Natronolimnohabitans innermongolicus]ELY59961.1 hypothetical protein C493_04493 [Natronolimnohabitans innermongolicus JCM 12255]
MPQGFAARFRDEVDVRDLGGAALVVPVLYAIGLEGSALGVLVGLFVLSPLLRAATEAAGLEIAPRVTKFVFGALFVAAGAVQLGDGSGWLSAALVVAGCWFWLDAIYDWRVGAAGAASETDAGREAADDVSTNEVYLYGGYNQWVLEELRAADRPLTGEELRSRTGIGEDDFERLLELHGDSGPIERVGTGYALDESELGTGAAVRSIVRTVGRRLFRPFRLFRPAVDRSADGR